jgi:WD domain, G-beta repeat
MSAPRAPGPEPPAERRSPGAQTASVADDYRTSLARSSSTSRYSSRSPASARSPDSIAPPQPAARSRARADLWRAPVAGRAPGPLRRAAALCTRQATAAHSHPWPPLRETSDSTARAGRGRAAARHQERAGCSPHAAQAPAHAPAPAERRHAAPERTARRRTRPAAGRASPSVLRGHRWNVYGVGWSPDGRWLASSGWDNAVRVWDTTTGADCARAPSRPYGARRDGSQWR